MYGQLHLTDLAEAGEDGGAAGGGGSVSPEPAAEDGCGSSEAQYVFAIPFDVSCRRRGCVSGTLELVRSDVRTSPK